MALIRSTLAASALALLSLASPPQPRVTHWLDDQWFKATATSSGYTIDDNDDHVMKASQKATAYLHFTWTGSNYEIEVWQNTGSAAAPVWEKTYSEGSSAEGANEEIFNDIYLEFETANGYFGGYMVCFSKLVVLNNVLKSGTFNSLGGEGTDGELNGNDFRGNLVLKSMRVPLSKLPFTP